MPKPTEPRPTPRLYLMTPLIENAEAFAAEMRAALGGGDIAAVLLRLTEADERSLINRAKALVPLIQKTGAAALLGGNAGLAARAGADGAHLNGIAEFESAVEALKPDRIAGAGGLSSRHDAMLAAERGADYVMFGEPDGDSERPGFAAIEERIAWWAEVFEPPCVGFAAAFGEISALVEAGADFVALGDLVWRDPRGAAAAISEAQARLTLPEKVS